MSERTIGELCEALVRLREEAEAGGGEKAVAKQHEKGKLTARERIDKLLDEGSFVELDAFVEHRCIHFGMEKKTFPGDGVVTGYGTVDGRLVYVYSQDFTVIGGSLGEMHARKICKVMDLAMQNGAPVLGLNDSGGARIQEAVDSLSGYGNIFYRNTVASGVVPQLSLILGPTAGGAVYSPALTDFIFMVDKIGILHITGPDVIKAVTGEDVTSEQIGGAMAHNQVSGNAHFFATTEDECFAQVRKLLSYLPSNNMEEPPFYDSGDDPYRTDESLRDLVPTNPNKGYRVQDVLTRIADGGEFFEVQAMWAKNIVTGFMRVGGYVAGVIANQAAIMAGCLDIDASEKAARFVRTCDAFNIPLVLLVDVPGFLPGADQEYQGILRRGAKLLYAYAEASVPKITVTMRKAYGGAYCVMGSKGLGADLNLAWPTAQIAVMGAAGAVGFLHRREIKAAIERDGDASELIKQYEQAYEDHMLNPYLAAERGLIDEVILPSETRVRIARNLRLLRDKKVAWPARKHGNMPL